MEDEPIFCLIKLGEQQHMEELRSLGRVYLNTWHHFRELEGDEARGDALEGTLSLFQAATTKLFVGQNAESSVPISGLIGHVTVANGNMDLYNLYCMFALTADSHDELKSERVQEFGGYAAVVTNGDEFLKRFRNALIERGYSFRHSLVSYIDTAKHNGAFGPFSKSTDYKHQSEFRILVRSGLKAPLQIDIGDLSDICFVFPAEELHWRFKPNYVEAEAP